MFLGWNRRSRFLLLLLFFLVHLSFAQGQARPGTSPQQAGSGVLEIIVLTPANSPFLGASVLLTDQRSGEQKKTQTDAKGACRFDALPAGDYSLLVSANGFADFTLPVQVKPQKASVLTVNLRPSSALSGPPGKSDSSTVGGVINSTSVRELPLNGRSATDLAALEPGVTTARTQAAGQGQYGFGAQMTISGSRPRQNDSRLDGISENDYSNGPPGSALGVNLGADAVEQFSVLTSNYPAQVGRSSGGVIAATTRAGTNDFHGAVFEFLRNSAFDAKNFFDTVKPPFRRNQFGASVGGPVIKDKTFFFVAYEGLRQSLGLTQVDTVPSLQARSGNLSTGAVTVDPGMLRFINAFFPLPNGPLLGAGDTGIYTFSGQEITPENFVDSRLDHKFSENDSLALTYLYDSGSVQQPDELNNKLTGYDTQRQLGTIRETHTFTPDFLNTFHAGANRIVARIGLTFPGENSLAADPTYGAVPGQNAPAAIVPGLTSFTGGLNGLSTFDFYWTSLQFLDDFSWTIGRHNLKFGASFERLRDNILGVTVPSGQFTFNSLAGFLTNAPFTFSTGLPQSVSERGFRQSIFGAYLQDDFRVRSNFTANLGLRYEMSTVPTEVNNKLTVLRNITDATPHLGSPLFDNSTLLNFEPRIGLSYSPFPSGKTMLSSGFGFFDVLPLPYEIQMNELFSAPYFQFGNVANLPAGSFPTGAFNIVANSPETFRQGYFEPHPQRNYIMQWNLTLQQDLGKGLQLRVGYVGARGLHQPFRVEDVDIVMPALTSAGFLWPNPIGSGTRLNLNSGRITAGYWSGDSYYNALQAQVKARLGRSGQLGGSYTWGKSIDTSSGSLVGDEYANSISSPLYFNPRLNRGLSDFNVAQNLEVNYSWEFPAVNLQSRLASWALNTWQVGGVLAASTGVPFTPGFAGDALGVNSTDPNIDLPDLVRGPNCHSLVNAGNPNHYINTNCFAVPASTPAIAAQCVNVINVDPHTGLPVPDPSTCLNLRGNLGRNTLIGPGLLNFDFSLFKNNYVKRISDTFNIQFRAEFFNVLNRANFAPPLANKNIFDSAGHPIANAGLITSTQTPSRQIQFAIKILW
jgi:hypothetical protein